MFGSFFIFDHKTDILCFKHRINNLLFYKLISNFSNQNSPHSQQFQKPITTFFPINQMNQLFQKCKICNQVHKQSELRNMNCQKHFVCFNCLPKNSLLFCKECQIIISESSSQTERQLRAYPIQGALVHHDKLYNPDGQSEFSSRRNCHQRTNGWILCNFLAVVFFFSGLAVAIKTSQVATGIIMAIIGGIGIIATIFFICKVRKVDHYYQKGEHLDQDKFVYIRKDQNERKTISSVGSDRNRRN